MTSKKTTLAVILGVVLTGLVVWHAHPGPKKIQARPRPLAATQPTYFAEIDGTGKVLRVIVADPAFIDSGRLGPAQNWVQTFPDQTQRGHYAGKNYTYDPKLDAFVPPKPNSLWVLDSQSYEWVNPHAPALPSLPPKIATTSL